MQEVILTNLARLILYLEQKGKFALKESDTKWIITGNPPVYEDVQVLIGNTSVVFSNNKSAVEEFYADEFKRFQEKPL